MSSQSRVYRLATCSLMLALATVAGRGNSADSEIAVRARETLSRRCFACHGANGVARKNVFILDRNRLVAAQTVVPGDSNSLLLKIVESGAMPLDGPALSKEE